MKQGKLLSLKFVAAEKAYTYFRPFNQNGLELIDVNIRISSKEMDLFQLWTEASDSPECIVIV